MNLDYFCHAIKCETDKVWQPLHISFHKRQCDLILSSLCKIRAKTSFRVLFRRCHLCPNSACCWKWISLSTVIWVSTLWAGSWVVYSFRAHRISPKMKKTINHNTVVDCSMSKQKAHHLWFWAENWRWMSRRLPEKKIEAKNWLFLLLFLPSAGVLYLNSQL